MKQNNSYRTPLQLVVVLLLTVVTLFSYGGVIHNDFINFDDNWYVTDNSHVKEGITLDGVRWSFSTGLGGLWHPLVWLSLMADAEIHGVKCGGYHLTNLLLHTANAILLFFIFLRMTGALWRSAFVAMLFAVHPLHVESVAWVSERKDVLSTLFWMLTIIAYLHYVKFRTWMRYVLVVVSFAAGLMTKPMLVTLPFVLLLLDYWPIMRWRWASDKRGASYGKKLRIQSEPLFQLITEKVPLFCMSAVLCVVTVMVMEPAILTPARPLLDRLSSALVGYAFYILKMFWPTNLAIFYPHPGTVPAWQVGGAALFLTAVSILALWQQPRRQYLLVGWLWFLGTLFPVSGIVSYAQVAFAADRYAYIPIIGIYLMIAWGTAEIKFTWRFRRLILGGLATVVILLLVNLTRAQVRHWKSSITLLEHTIAVIEDDAMIYNNYGMALFEIGQVNEAISQYQKALRLSPQYADAHNNLGVAMGRLGNVDQAVFHFREAVEIKPQYADAHNNLAIALVRQGHLDQAISHYQKALEYEPGNVKVHVNLGVALVRVGRLEEAISHYREAIRLNPGYMDAQVGLGIVFLKQGRTGEAISHYQKALEYEPGNVKVHVNLGLALVRVGRPEEAISHYREAIQSDPVYAPAYTNLGLLLLGQGEISLAIDECRKAIEIDAGLAEAHYCMGLAHAGKGDRESAIKEYEILKRINPELAELLSERTGLTKNEIVEND